jgi:hypothetical protein
VAGLPSAGGKPPVWQEPHWLVTVTCEWFHLVGRQPVVLWQEKQLVPPTGMCTAGLPVAAEPLWQLLQLVAALNVAWSTLPAAQLVVDRWQFSQVVCPVWTVVLGLMPAWQVAHCAVTVTLLCRRAGVQLLKPAL